MKLLTLFISNSRNLIIQYKIPLAFNIINKFKNGFIKEMAVIYSFFIIFKENSNECYFEPGLAIMGISSLFNDECPNSIK